MVATLKAVPRIIGIERNRWHQYRVNNGRWQPGATTVLRVQDAIQGSDALVTWAAKTAAEEALAAFGGGLDRDAAYNRAVESVTHARDRGTAVHAAIEAAIRDEEHVPDSATNPYWYGWSRFLVKERPEIVRTEQMLINETVGYGGTLDLVAVIRGRMCQIDIKTGQPKPSHALQLAAYSAAEQWGAPGALEDPIELEAHYVLALAPTGYELVEMRVTDEEREHFAFLATTYHRLKAWKNGKREEVAA